MFSIRQNFLQRSTRLLKKSQLLTTDVAYKGQPFVQVVSKNQNTLGLDTVYNAQPFLASSDNRLTGPVFIGTNHPDVENWLKNLITYGGSANSTTIAALNAFCNSIDNAGIRSKFYRLNLFCGNNLNSCLVPLYFSKSANNVQYGSPTDINYNFISSDYNETGVSAGLTSSGADPAQQLVGTKYLDCTIKPSDIIRYGQPITSMHLAATASCTAISAGSQSVFYNTYGYVDFYTLAFQILGDGYVYMRSILGSSSLNTQVLPLTSGLISPAQHFISSRISNVDSRNYQSGTQSGSTNTTTISTVMASSSVPFFLFRQSAGYYGNLRITDYSIGLGLTSSEALSYYNALQTFKTALTRS